VYLPDEEVNLSSSNTADMMGLFVYGGRLYVEYEWLNDAGNLAGKYLGRATGLIDEWTKADGYVEFAGSVEGDIYTVNGYDPEFMLCMEINGRLCTYIARTGYRLNTGHDLFEDRMKLTELYDAAYFRKVDVYDLNDRPKYELVGTEHTALVDNFTKAINEAYFMYTSEIPLKPGCKSYHEMQTASIRLTKTDGTSVKLHLYDGGYVRLDMMFSVCVKIDESIYNELLEIQDGDIK